MTANAKAGDLRSRLFGLLTEFKEFAQSIHTVRRQKDAVIEAHGQADNFACGLAELYLQISGPSPVYDLFTDEAKDAKDQEYTFALPDGIATDFATQLRALRERANLSAAALADAADVSRESIRLYELGERRPTWDAVQAIAKALGVTTDTFRGS